MSFGSFFKRDKKTENNTVSATTVEEKDGVLIISDSYVDDKKYAGNDTIQKVVFTDSVYRIRSEAFKDCRNLTTVEFQSNKYRFPEIFADAFANTPWASEQGDWVKYEDVLLFYQGEPKQQLIIPADVKYIHQLFCVNNVFDDTRKIDFEAESNCEVICEKAFYGCRKLERIIFPDTLTHIMRDAFLGCTGLKEVYFQKQSSMKKDSFPGDMMASVYIPSGAIKPDSGWDIQSKVIREHMDYWMMMLKAKDAESFDNGTSFKTLLNYAINECQQLGELKPGADETAIHQALSRFHYFNVLKKDTPEHDYDGIRAWYVFPQDHFYCRMVYYFFHNYVVKPKDKRKGTIALWLKDKKALSSEELENIRIFVETIGYSVEIFLKSGHRDDMKVDCESEIADRLVKLGEKAWVEEDEHPEEIGDIYLELLSGKQYHIESDWCEKEYTERYDGGYEEEVPYIAFEHYLSKDDI